MTLYQIRMHSSDFSRGRKLDTGEARELGESPKFQAGLEREKKRLAELRKKYNASAA